MTPKSIQQKRKKKKKDQLVRIHVQVQKKFSKKTAG